MWLRLSGGLPCVSAGTVPHDVASREAILFRLCPYWAQSPSLWLRLSGGLPCVNVPKNAASGGHHVSIQPEAGHGIHIGVRGGGVQGNSLVGCPVLFRAGADAGRYAG